jgi:shikimate dehydrogenase
MIKPFPNLCGSVAGNPSELGVKMHNAGYLAKGLDYTYIAMGSDNIEKAISIFKDMAFKGMGVSMPFKQSVIKFLDEIDDAVQKIGACNTVVNENKKLVGHNTDWIGALNAIKEVENINLISKAVIVGSGGVARSIAYALKKHNKEVYISARNKSQREQLVKDLNLDGASNLEEQNIFSADLIVNATPCADENGPVKIHQHKNASVLLDVVFQTKTTALVKAASSLGIKTACGWRMLLLQGAEQFELYTKESAPLDAMGQVLEKWLIGK